MDAKNGSMGTSTPCVLPQKLEDNKGLSEKLDSEDKEKIMDPNADAVALRALPLISWLVGHADQPTKRDTGHGWLV